jgi:hypothetical protein
MKTKKAYKIGVSLLIMLSFILPTVSIADEWSTEGNLEAGEYQSNIIDYDGPMKGELSKSGITPQAAGDIHDLGVRMIAPDGDIYEIPPPYQTFPIEDYYRILVGTNTELQTLTQDCPEIQAGASLYTVTSGLEVPLYETSFEDNYDIYMNWVQIDGDCAVGGYYDSWSWSDARSSDGDHSMKSTMYDEYKQSQDDWLEMRNCYDISDQYYVKFQFDTWVEGQWNWEQSFTPSEIYDYLHMEIYDNGVWWEHQDFGGWLNWYWNPDPFDDIGIADTTIPVYYPRGGYDLIRPSMATGVPKVQELGDGWWRVTMEYPVAWFTDPTCVKFRFYWHTDPQFEFEGAYVDNFKMISIEGIETKIWQTHLQECTEINCMGHTWTEFPLKWDDVEPGDYYWLVWVETENCPTAAFYESTFPKPGLRYDFSIDDVVDCRIINMFIEDSFTHVTVPPDGRMTEGADAHVVFTVHNNGNIPMENIPIEFTVFKEEWQEILSYDAESAMGAIFGAACGRSDFDSFSGDSSIYFGDETHMQYTLDSWGYVEFSKNINFEENKRVDMDYYYKLLLDDTQVFHPTHGILNNDIFYPVIFDNYQNNVLGSGFFYYSHSPWAVGGYSPEWIGPTQPRGVYQPAPMKDAYLNYKALGFFRDFSGVLDPETTIGFVFIDNFWVSIPNTETNAQAYAEGIYWSGVFVDDVTVSTLSSTGEVFTDSLVVPGPLEFCDTATMQFEWEDVPFSYYKLCVEAICDKDVNPDNNIACQQIFVADDLERIDKPEAIDNSGDCDGEWGLCTGAPQWQLSSNPDSMQYPNDAIYAVQFKDCLIGDGINPIEFDVWFELEDGWDFVTLEATLSNCPPSTIYDWFTISDWTGSSEFGYTMTGTGGTMAMIGDIDDDFDGWYHYTSAPQIPPAGLAYTVRFIMDADAYTNDLGFLVDNFYAPGMLEVDTFDTFDNWENVCIDHGVFWNTNALPYCLTLQPLTGFSQSLIWASEIEDAYEAWLSVYLTYDMATATARLEISGDGGSTWHHLDSFGPGTLLVPTAFGPYDVSYLAGQEVLIKFTVNGAGALTEFFCVEDATIAGKQDLTAPTSTATMSGTMKESGWYTTSVSVTITATDEGAGMGEIHYILDGVETVVAGDTASFTVSGNGEHTIEYWAVDIMGNEEAHHFIPAFRIDSGSPPSVAITAPEPGLYLFGNKLLSASKVIIIGAFTVEATASDAESGIYRVQFFLDGDLVSEDTEVPFSAYVAEKHMGAGTIRVVAEDYAQNTAEDTLDITYYKFL